MRRVGLGMRNECWSSPSEHGRWAGRLTVLTEASTYGASEDFLLGLQGLEHVTVLGEVTGAAVAGLERSRSRRPKPADQHRDHLRPCRRTGRIPGDSPRSQPCPPGGRSLIPRDPPSMLQGTSRTTHWPTIRVRARPDCWSRWPWTQTPACERWWHPAQWIQRGSAAASAPDAAHTVHGSASR